MRLFLDTEFTAFRDGKLLSVGLVGEAGPECYVELPSAAEGSTNEFLRTQVLAQFGVMPGAAVATLADLGGRVAQFLGTLEGPLELCFDYKLDHYLLEDALRRSALWSQLESRLSWCNVADELSHPACRLASARFLARRSGPLAQHHALQDARALREAWRAKGAPGAAEDAMFARVWLFLGYEGSDARGRSLQAILAANDEDLEAVHDYIQWLFPLTERSQFNLDAPVLSEAEFAEIGSDPVVAARLEAAFVRMLRFYGLRYDPQRGVAKGVNWAQRSDNWAFFPGHNDLRITRILRSLCLLGRRDLSLSFLAALEPLAKECRGLAKDRPLSFWRAATS